MPRYFFHIRKGDVPMPDDEGAEFQDLEAAKAEAVHSCRDLAVQEIRRGGPVTFCKVEIWDDGGKLLDTIHAHEVFEGPKAGPDR